MALAALYLGIAFLLAPSIFAVAEWHGHDHLRHRWFYALIAGLAWPLLAVGLLQFGLIIALRRALGEPARTLPDFDEADSGQLPRLPIPYVPLGTTPVA